MSPTILVVDDDETVLDVIRQFLEAARFCCATTLDGRQTIGILEKEPVEVVILDYSMPLMNGAQVAEAIAEFSTRTGRPIQIIMLTGQGDPRVALQLVRLPNVEYMAKPPRFGVFVQAVQRAADRYRSALAMVQPAPNVAAEPAPDSRSAASRPHSILVVEDDLMVLEQVRSLLTQKDYGVVCCTEADQMLPLIRRHPIEVVVLNYYLANADGKALVKEISSLSRTIERAIQIILLTGQTDRMKILEMVKMPYVVHLSKPVQPEPFLAEIDRALTSVRARSMH